MEEKVYRIPYKTALMMTEDIFRACGMSEQDAHMLADSLVLAMVASVFFANLLA